IQALAFLHYMLPVENPQKPSDIDFIRQFLNEMTENQDKGTIDLYISMLQEKGRAGSLLPAAESIIKRVNKNFIGNETPVDDTSFW
uniref:Uncharacterized protein n=1 Tax=Acrobeloides nanus TaxID=290746 RepID=A0A914DYG5_9BILA